MLGGRIFRRRVRSGAPDSILRRFSETPYGELAIQGPIAVHRDATFDQHVSIGPIAEIDRLNPFYAGADSRVLLSLGELMTEFPPDFVEGVASYLHLNPRLSPTAFIYAGDFEARTHLANSFDFSWVAGLYGDAAHQGTGTADVVIGLEMYAENLGAGNVAGLWGMYCQVGNYGSGTLTNGYGLFIDRPVNSGGGTYTNNYGIGIEDQTSGGTIAGNNFNLFSEGVTAKHIVEGTLGIGNLLSPAGKVHIKGTADVVQLVVDGFSSQSANLLEFRNSVPSIQLAIAGNGRDFILDTVTGTKWGTAVGQKQAWWGATPIVQPAGIVDADGTLADITTKYNSLLAKLELMGLLAVA